MIRVLTKRTIKSTELNSAKQQLNALYKNVRINKGFVNAKSYIDTNRYIDNGQTNLWTISDWSSQYDWDNWLNSDIRLTTLNNNKFVIQN